MPKIDFSTIEPMLAGPAEYHPYIAPIYRGEHVEIQRGKYRRGEAAKRHSHSEEQIVYVLEGKLTASIGDEEFEVAAGQGYHVPPNTPHNLTVIEDIEMLSFKNGFST